MSQVISSQWPGNEFAPYRQGRMPCGYEAFVPDSLTGTPIRLDGEVAADVMEAEAAISRLNSGAFALADTEALARLLLRAESVASSRSGRGSCCAQRQRTRPEKQALTSPPTKFSGTSQP
jgi:hypothetical protein